MSYSADLGHSHEDGPCDHHRCTVPEPEKSLCGTTQDKQVSRLEEAEKMERQRDGPTFLYDSPHPITYVSVAVWTNNNRGRGSQEERQSLWRDLPRIALQLHPTTDPSYIVAHGEDVLLTTTMTTGTRAHN